MSTATRIVLVRHGASRSTEIGIVGGHLGCRGLSVDGVLQAESLSRRWLRTPPFTSDFPLGAIYSSVLPRALETAKIALSPLGLDVGQALCDLCEIHPGEADGMTWDQVSESFGDFDIYHYPTRPIAPGGESWKQMQERVIGALTLLADSHRGQSVLVFCHKGVIDATIENWLGVSPRPLSKGSQNTSMTIWLAETDEKGEFNPMLICFNDAAHLETI